MLQRPIEFAEGAGINVVEHIWHDDLRQWLTESGNDILSILNQEIAATHNGSQLAELVKAADQVSVKRNLNNESPYGVSAATHIIDAMRRMVAQQTWRVNCSSASVFIERDGPNCYAYLPWPDDAADIKNVLNRDRVPGIPKDPNEIAEILLDAGQALPYAEDGIEQMYWPIRTPYTCNITRYCLKISAEIFFPDEYPPSIDIEVVPREEAKAAVDNEQAAP